MNKKNLDTEKHLINGIDPYDFTKEKVGEACVYSRHIPWSSVIHIRFLFNFGAMHDESNKEGTAHFLEHMIFQGNPIYKDKFEIDQFSKKYTLDSLNAFTAFSHVSVHFRCLPEHINEALEGIYQMLSNSYLREEDIEKERSIIIQEAWGRYVNNEHIEYLKKEKENIYHDMPDRLRLQSPLGWPDTIPNIQKKDLEFSRGIGFTQKNLSVIVAGVVTPATLDAVRRYVSKLPTGEEIKKLYVPKEMGDPLEKVWVFSQKERGLTNTKQAKVSLSSGITKEYPCTEAVKIVTSDLLYELLFKEIRHKHNWCYKVLASFGNTEDLTFGEIGTTVDPEHILETIKLLHNIVDGIISGKHMGEFEQEKQLRLDRKAAVELTTDDVASSAVGDLRFDGKIETRKESFKDLEEVAYDDIVKLLKETIKGSTAVTEVYVLDECNTNSLREQIRSMSV